MRRIACFIFALASILSLCGCLRRLFPTSEPGPPVSGILYTEVDFPLTLNHSGESLANLTGKNDVKSIREPLTGAGIRVLWDSNAIGDIAKKHGIERIHFADVRVLSVLFGLWNQYEVCIVGETPAQRETP